MSSGHFNVKHHDAHENHHCRKHEIAPNSVVNEIHHAAEKGDYDKLHSLAMYWSGNVVLNVRDARGETAMHLAVKTGHFECMKTLFEGRADINHTNHAGQTPLDVAEASGHKKCVDFLEHHGGTRSPPPGSCACVVC